MRSAQGRRKQYRRSNNFKQVKIDKKHVYLLVTPLNDPQTFHLIRLTISCGFDMMLESDKRLEFAIDLAFRAGVLGMKFFRKLESLTIELKGHQNLVSNGDREVELLVRAAIAEAYPDDGIVGEEYASVKGTTGHIWVIDPIDGTANFVRGIPQWCVIIGCAKDGAAHIGVIHEPSSGETFWARRGGGAFCNGKPISTSAARNVAEGSIGVGVSARARHQNIVPVVQAIIENGGMFFRNASGGLMLSYVAAGRLLGYVEEHMNSWDCLAGMLIVEEAGGIVEPFSLGDPITNGAVGIAAAPGVFDWLHEISARPFGLV